MMELMFPHLILGAEGVPPEGCLHDVTPLRTILEEEIHTCTSDTHLTLHRYSNPQFLCLQSHVQNLISIQE